MLFLYLATFNQLFDESLNTSTLLIYHPVVILPLSDTCLINYNIVVFMMYPRDLKSKHFRTKIDIFNKEAESQLQT